MLVIVSCTSTEIKPIDIYPEDECANCRMTVSTDAFASEIITKEGNVYKFDDLSCLEQFLKTKEGVLVAAIFVKDFNSRTWLKREESYIIHTTVNTPMGSGKIAFADSLQAQRFVQEHQSLQRAEAGKER